jgi:hypothetical protein
MRGAAHRTQSDSLHRAFIPPPFRCSARQTDVVSRQSARQESLCCDARHTADNGGRPTGLRPLRHYRRASLRPCVCHRWLRVGFAVVQRDAVRSAKAEDTQSAQPPRRPSLQETLPSQPSAPPFCWQHGALRFSCGPSLLRLSEEQQQLAPASQRPKALSPLSHRTLDSRIRETLR